MKDFTLIFEDHSRIKIKAEDYSEACWKAEEYEYDYDKKLLWIWD